MLDFRFNEMPKDKNSTILILLGKFGSLTDARLVKKLGKTVIDALHEALEIEELKSSCGQSIKTYVNGQPCLAFIFDETKPIAMGKKIYALLRNYMNANVYVPENLSRDVMEKLAIGMENANYSFDKYCTKKKAEDFDKLEVVNFIGGQMPDVEKIVALTNAVRYARDFGNEPANRLTPYEFVKDVERLNYLNLDVEVLDEEMMKREKFGLALAVAQGSCNLPYTVVLRWKGNPKKDDFDCGLVGKGVIYDSGGLSLKSSAGLRSMKQDMSGAADVVSVMKAAALKKLPLNLVAVVTLVENMLSANAYKVDDIITSMSGQTVEIINTDAEGRLALADSLWYIQKRFKVKTVVDIATLTGSVYVTFGGLYAAIFGNDDKLIQKLIKSGEDVEENLWQLPLHPEYDKWLNSPVADMQNLGKKGMAGASTAATFLKRFIQKSTKWAHLDIASCECDDNSKVSTGFGVMLLYSYLESLCLAKPVKTLKR